MPSNPPDANRNQRRDDQQPSPSSGDSTQRAAGDEIIDDGSATVAHQPRRPTVFDKTIISKRTPDDDRVAPPPATPLSNTEIGKRLVGTQLDEYLLEEFIGGGGMGTVFRAADKKLARTVAVKVLTARYGEDDEDTRRFELEAQSAARLNHENIAHVYGIGKADGWQYIVFEFIDGQNLRDVVQAAGPLSLEDTVDFSLQVAAALDHASARDLVHRDIKPSNVIITPERQAKLVDMGLARMREVEREDEDLTASGVTLGTFDYISPEQGSDPRSADVRSDLYSLGCTMFFMLTGQPPFPTGTALQKLLNHANTPPPEMRRLRPDVPQGLVEIVTRLLAKDPAERFQHPRELTQAIIAFADSRDLPAPYRPIRRRRRPVSRGPWAQHAEWLAPILLLLFGIFVVEQVRKPRFPVADELPVFATPTSISPGNLSEPNSAPLRMPSAQRRNRRALSSIPPEPNSTSLDVDGAANTAGQNIVVTSPTDTIHVVSASSGSAVDQQTVFDSAQAALEAMQSNPNIKRIEFATTGRFSVTPIRLEGRDLEIVATAGTWPVLEFRQLLANNCAWQISGGKLHLDGVHLNFVPESKASLFRLSQVELLELRNLWITVLGSPERPAYVANVAAEQPQPRLPTEVDELPSLVARQRVLPSAVSLTDCVIRGHVTVLRGNAEQPCRLTWNNGFLCTTERLAELTGTANRSSEIGPQQIDVDHVTAITDRGLLQVITTELEAELPAIDLNCTRSIFATKSDSPFIAMHGSSGSLGRFESVFFYGGQRNFYESITNFWQVGNEPAQNFSEWQNRWSASESLAQYDQVSWRNRGAFQLPREWATPGHFSLAESLANPARSAAGGLERNDAGFRIAELPSPWMHIAFP